MSLPPDRLDRFARHIVLPEIGGAGQVALARAHVVLVGCGGIGSPALQYLAAAGVGQLTLIDDDVVEASNLQRQTIFSTGDIGRGKAAAAANWVRHFDLALEVHARQARIEAGNAGELIAGADVVLDGCDNFATRLAVSDACVKAGVPLTSAALGRFQGQVGTSRAFPEASRTGTNTSTLSPFSWLRCGQNAPPRGQPVSPITKRRSGLARAQAAKASTSRSRTAPCTYWRPSAEPR